MTREQMINELVEARIETIFDCDPEIWIENILRNGAGFKPYDQMTDDELCDEYCEEFPIDGDGE